MDALLHWVCGRVEQGAGFDHGKVRGSPGCCAGFPLIATVSTDISAPGLRPLGCAAETPAPRVERPRWPPRR
ncbi:hypothetical protein BJF90_43055 [Pseudonocardia sp. CNS-004]|nr:hypothetical protein BJF90_43055 [Pseudonocardia sp. CNS-004]